MKRSQWFILGAGLILLAFYFFYILLTSYCFGLSLSDLDYAGFLSSLKNEGIDNYNVESAEIIFCLETSFILNVIVNIFFALGNIFVIIGFLEPKKHHEG